ncbi:MAG: hypothetical protein JWO97_3868 [Acidobacteria bacterium]|nr:hypothetical protein [Acidobacteriota bacterium]
MSTRQRAGVVAGVLVLFLGLAVSLDLRGAPLESTSLTPNTQQPSSQEDRAASAISRDSDGFTARPGYVGPAFVGDLSGRIVVLADSIRATTSGNWSAQALIRNEREETISQAHVTAHLFDAGHHELGSANAAVELKRVRSGEPAPFVMTSDIPSSLVASVEWAVGYTPQRTVRSLAAAPAVADDELNIQFSVFWQRPYGHTNRLSGYPQNDSGDGPYPYVIVGEIHNSGTRPIGAARVLAAWLDDAGKVIHVDWLSLRPAARDLVAERSALLPSDGYVDFSYANSDPAVAPRLSGARLVLWGDAQ